MDYQFQNNGQGIQSLIELGSRGHFPLFPQEWFEQFNLKNIANITKAEKEKAQKIVNRLSKHKSLDRKRTILYSLTQKEREAFMKVFFNMVEVKIINDRKELH